MKPYHLFDDVIALAGELAHPARTERLASRDALGRVLAEDAVAAMALPPFPRAMMDGYAVRTDDLPTNDSLQVTATVGAGSSERLTIGPGEAIRIMTGAQVPDGADAVVRFEWCEQPAPNRVRVLRPVAAGDSIQSAGDDAPAGAVLVPRGTTLGFTELAVLRSFAVHDVVVYKPLRVALVVTGSELVHKEGQSLARGQIYGCNDLLLEGRVTASAALVQSVDYVPDDLSQLRDVLRRRSEEADCILTTGGVSAGDYDFVPGALRELGAALHVEHVWMRPGSPFVAASIGDCTVFGMSGNPAACLVQFEMLAAPFFAAYLGRSTNPFPAAGLLAADLELKPIKHVRILRALARVEDGCVRVDTDLAQSPGVVSSLTTANCLIRIDDEETAKSGTSVPLRWLRSHMWPLGPRP